MTHALGRLKTRRRELSARSSALSTSIAKLDSLRSHVASAEAALSEHDADAADAMRQWAMDGGEGDPPASDHQLRAVLLRDLAKAQANLQHAGDAHAQLSGEAQQVGQELAGISFQLELAAIDALIIERAEELAAFDELIEKTVRPRLAHLASLHTAIVERGHFHLNSGRSDQSRAILARAEQINFRPAIDYPEPGAIVAAADGWAMRFAELLGEPVAAPQPEPEHIKLAREQSFRDADARARGTTQPQDKGSRARLNEADPALVEKPRLAEIGGVAA